MSYEHHPAHDDPRLPFPFPVTVTVPGHHVAAIVADYLHAYGASGADQTGTDFGLALAVDGPDAVAYRLSARDLQLIVGSYISTAVNSLAGTIAEADLVDTGRAVANRLSELQAADIEHYRPPGAP